MIISHNIGFPFPRSDSIQEWQEANIKAMKKQIDSQKWPKFNYFFYKLETYYLTIKN